MKQGDGGRPLAPEVRWTVGCLVGGAALTGGIILVMLVAYFLQPPTWVQVVLGGVLALGGALFAGLVASALGQARDKTTPDLRPVPEEDSRPDREGPST